MHFWMNVNWCINTFYIQHMGNCLSTSTVFVLQALMIILPAQSTFLQGAHFCISFFCSYEPGAAYGSSGASMSPILNLFLQGVQLANWTVTRGQQQLLKLYLSPHLHRPSAMKVKSNSTKQKWSYLSHQTLRMYICAAVAIIILAWAYCSQRDGSCAHCFSSQYLNTISNVLVFYLSSSKF